MIVSFFCLCKSDKTVPRVRFIFSCTLVQTLIPLDFKRAGQILDDDLYKRLVLRMSKDVTVVVLMDCCHSGTALDLPYEINATQSKMQFNNGFDMGMLGGAADAFTCCLCAMLLLDFIGD